MSVEQEAIEESEVIPLVQEVERPLADPPLRLSTTGAIFSPKEVVMSKDFLNFPDTGKPQFCICV